MKVINNNYTRKVKYLDAEFSIPENHSYIATDIDGAIYSFYSAPDFNGEDWYNEQPGFCRIGTAELHSSEAATSLQSYTR